MSLKFIIKTEKPNEVREKLKVLDERLQKQMNNPMLQRTGAGGINCVLHDNPKPNIIRFDINFPSVMGFNTLLRREFTKVVKSIDEHAIIEEENSGKPKGLRRLYPFGRKKPEEAQHVDLGDDVSAYVDVGEGSPPEENKA